MAEHEGRHEEGGTLASLPRAAATSCRNWSTPEKAGIL